MNRQDNNNLLILKMKTKCVFNKIKHLKLLSKPLSEGEGSGKSLFEIKVT